MFMAIADSQVSSAVTLRLRDQNENPISGYHSLSRFPERDWFSAAVNRANTTSDHGVNLHEFRWLLYSPSRVSLSALG